MNRIFLLLTAIVLSSCGNFVVNETEGKKAVEGLLNNLQNEDYDTAFEYYSPEYNEQEPIENKKAKFDQLKQACGKRISFEFISSEKVFIDDRDLVVFTYEIICEKIELTEIFYVGLEDGKHYVLRHNTSNNQ